MLDIVLGEPTLTAVFHHGAIPPGAGLILRRVSLNHHILLEAKVHVSGADKFVECSHSDGCALSSVETIMGPNIIATYW